MDLFNDLMNLCDTNDGFFFKDFDHTDGATYRIFNYRLVGWEEFHTLPSALECRGVMYRQSNDTWKLVSRPPLKFFNLHEGDVNHDLSNPMIVMLKEDGSLISTFIDARGMLGMKSKGSLSSQQAIESRSVVSGLGTSGQLWYVTKEGYTVNLEYVSPTNRVVLAYEKPQLVVLNFRHTQTGEYFTLDEIESELCQPFNLIRDMMVHQITQEEMATYMSQNNIKGGTTKFLQSVPEMDVDLNGNVWEGVVVQKSDGSHIKIKSRHYVLLHHSKDSVNNPKALYHTVLEDATDDLRTLFEDDQLTLDLISKMEQVVDPIYNHMVVTVESYHEANKELERKDYAIKGQQELSFYEFGLAMNLYVGKPVNYVGVMKKRWQSLSDGIIKDVYGVTLASKTLVTFSSV